MYQNKLIRPKSNQNLVYNNKIWNEVLWCNLEGHIYLKDGLPWGLCGKESACQCKSLRFSLWVGKIPQRRKWQPIPVFLPGKPYRQTGLSGKVHRVAKSWTQLSDWAWARDLIKKTVLSLKLLWWYHNYSLDPHWLISF